MKKKEHLKKAKHDNLILTGKKKTVEEIQEKREESYA